MSNLIDEIHKSGRNPSAMAASYAYMDETAFQQFGFFDEWVEVKCQDGSKALVLKPLLIIADEPVSMLDVSIRFQILELMKNLRDKENVSFLYITHDLSTSQYVGDNIIILYKGQIIEQGDIHEVLRHPLHPYTKALISAIPRFNDYQEINIKTELGSSDKCGCKFLTKCLYSSEECSKTEPELIAANHSHFIRCYNYDSI